MATTEDYNMVFNISDAGREVLKDMMLAHHFYSSSFSPDPYTMAKNEGERNVILRILTMLDEYEKEVKVDGKISDG